MTQKIFIGKISKGMEQYFLPFAIDNDAFPLLFNAYAWRGRIKKKRGTIPVGRLQRPIQIAAPGLGNTIIQFPSRTLDGSGSINLVSSYGIEANSNIVPGSIHMTVNGDNYTDPNKDGTLTSTGAHGGTINYATTTITFTAQAGQTLNGTSGLVSFSYFPDLPVLGLEDLVLPATNSQYPLLMAFDQKYPYQITQTSPPNFYVVDFYKSSQAPFTFTGQDYQQFWSCNYQGAFWVTNNVPGLHYANGTYVSGSGTTNIKFNFKSPAGANIQTLVDNDKIWFNEWNPDPLISNINLLTGTIIDASDALNGNYVVQFAQSQITAGTGIVQLLTSRVQLQNGKLDGIMWYDGDMTNKDGIPITNQVGWVNFAPPLTATTVSINDKVPKPYYLAGALAIVPFKDRLIFFSPWIQAADGTAAIQLTDTALWSWNGTPYYTIQTASTNQAALVPTSETADPTAYFVDQTGKGGYISSGLNQAIRTISNNEDVLLVGFTGKQTRFVYTSNDVYPFLFYIINSELGAESTYSGITLDRGALTMGTYGFALTAQIGSQRIDLQIPNQVFQLNANNNAAERISAARDYYHEWVYFTFVPNNSRWKFPTQTFQYNYREESWSVHYENYTTHGYFRNSIGIPWSSATNSWAASGSTWTSGSFTPLFPSVIAGNPQGFVVVKGLGTGEAPTGAINAITNNGGLTQINSHNHCVSASDGPNGGGDYLYFLSILGLLSSSITGISNATQAVITTVNTFTAGQNVTITGVAGMTQLNGNTYEIVAATGASITINVDSTNFGTYTSGGTVTSAINGLIGRVTKTIDADNFVVDIPFPTFGANGYQGLGTYTRLIQPLIQTKQFPIYWNEGRKVRVGAQKYLMDTTTNGQVSVFIYLSQNPDDAWNNTPINPDSETTNNSLVYSTTMFTCPESTNAGLTQFTQSINNPDPIASSQYQIWHRINTSLIGDTFQIGITLNDSQMRMLTNVFEEITLHAMQIDVGRGPMLS